MKKNLILGIIGGIIYYNMEVLWRGYSHPSMAIVGGIAFLIIGSINENKLTWDIPLFRQCFIAANYVILLEFVSGVILNILLKWHIWDYTDMPFNLFGQICLSYYLLWYPVSIIAIVIDDWLRYLIFNEDEPHYTV